MPLFSFTALTISWLTAHKIIESLACLVVFSICKLCVQWLISSIGQNGRNEHLIFWIRQLSNLLLIGILIVCLVALWFDDPARLTSALALVTAGLSFAMQNVVTSVAGYFVILRGRNFSVGDRITMGAVRGDVIALGFIQTTIMEMGQPPAVQSSDPAVWVRSRQHTGRIVTIANNEIFKSPVYNYTRDFPYIWEEMSIPITYGADRTRAEQVLLDAAEKHALKVSDVGVEELKMMLEEYFILIDDITPKVFYRITDNWLELTVRFLYDVRGVRDLKDVMSREILAGFDAAGIGIASSTYDIVGFPKLQLEKPPAGG